ncbi:Rap1a/Tai family immunity protein [Mesorhizobium sp.]|uniref:Rap1a/Tai family immunity protein n=1 Tax=Mesorhizobium sp. TaxID=1871066 RepID=UPI00342AF374
MLAGSGYAGNNDADVQSLLAQCKPNNGGWSYCLGYVGGVADMMAMNGVLSPRPALSICVGQTIPTYGAYQQAFINWAEAHPEKWQSHQGFGVIESLRATWPCP